MERSVPISVIVGLLGTSALFSIACITLLLYGASGALSPGLFFASLLSSVFSALTLTVAVTHGLKDLWLDNACRPPFVLGSCAALAASFALYALVLWLVEAGEELLAVILASLSFVTGGCLANLVLLWGGMWGLLFASHDDRRLCFCALCGAFVSSLLCFALALGLGASILVALFSVACIVLVGGCYSALRRTLSAPSKSWGDSCSDDASVTALRLRPYTAGFAVALFAVYMISEIGFAETMEGFSLGGAIALFVLVSYVIQRREVPSFFIEPWMFFLLEIIVILAYVIGVNALLLAIFGGCFAVYYLMYFLAINLTSSRSGLNPYAHFAMRIFRPMVGVAVGLVASMLFFVFLERESAVPLITLLAFGTLCLNHLRDPHYWQEWASLYRFANGISEAPPSVELGKVALHVVRWEDSCRELAEMFGLSEREKDVFVLLAKGRNAALIAEKLYISANTARTHIYRVYSKTGLKNQQELISFVEEKQSEQRTV